MILENERLVSDYTQEDHDRAKLLEYLGFVWMSNASETSWAVLGVYGSAHEHYLKLLESEIPDQVRSASVGVAEDVKEYHCPTGSILIDKARQLFEHSRYARIRSNLRLFDAEIQRIEEATIEDFEKVNALI